MCKIVPLAQKRQFATAGAVRGCRNYFSRLMLLGVCLFSSMGLARAEQYLTVRETRELCFPAATRFEVQEIGLSSDQADAIAKRSGVKVRKREVQFQFAYAGEKQVGVLIVDQVIGKHDLIDYAVALCPEGKVLQVEILEYRERYGSEIRSPKWREQFAGKGPGARLKLNEDIYNISGATISCRHVSEGIKRLLATYELVGRDLLSAGRVPDGSAVAHRR